MEFDIPIRLIEIASPNENEVVETLEPLLVLKARGDIWVRLRLTKDSAEVFDEEQRSTSGTSLGGGFWRLEFQTNLSAGTRYKIEAYARLIGGDAEKLQAERMFATRLSAPAITVPETHFYINPLPVTLSLVTNATWYQLRWRRIGAPSWNEFLPQPPSNRTFVIASSALDDALVVLNGIEVQGRAFNDVVSSAWSAIQTIDIREPDFTMAWASPAPPATIVQEFGFPIKQFDVNLTRTPANSERIDLQYLPTPQVDPALNFTFKDFAGNSFTGGNIARAI